MTRALTATLTALCIAGYIALPALADDATAANATSATTTDAAAAAGASATVASASDANTDASANAPTSAAAGVTNGSDSGTTAAIADKSGVDSSSESSKADDNDKKAIADNAKDPKGGKDGSDKDSKDAKKDPTAKAAGKTSGKGGGDVGLPTRLGAFTAGVVVGTPIAILRRTHMEFMQGEHDLIGDFDTWWKKALFVFPGALMCVPFGGVSGGLGGCMYSVKNAWAGSGDEPFGKESFSLGDIGN